MIEVSLEFIAKDAGKAVSRGDLVIVVDVLRTTTSIITAISRGARSIIPTETLREAYQLHSRHPNYLLVGERNGRRPRGFDFGNSPQELMTKEIRGKDLIITTTNGTRALTGSKQAKWVLSGAFLNAAAIAKKAVEISGEEQVGASFVLAGEEDRFSLEDFACAGAIVEGFPKSDAHLSDETLAAMAVFKQIRSNLCENIARGEHAKRLIELGLGKDIEFSCQIDVCDVIPVYADGRIRRLKNQGQIRLGNSEV
ncbi:MAG TPA: 2-phosphosulfolactate phosphatase [Candidatus Bathyarchaeia archaeon]|nr:2-phosphosulfolactate phosphatase [Candidatus Bathyarchaeia archaeon]